MQAHVYFTVLWCVSCGCPCFLKADEENVHAHVWVYVLCYVLYVCVSCVCPCFTQADEEKAIRLEPLGMDRRYNRYWRVTPLVTATGHSTVPDTELQGSGAAQPPVARSGDPDVGRLYVETADGSK